jgi:hypothetical protein
MRALGGAENTVQHEMHESCPQKLAHGRVTMSTEPTRRRVSLRVSDLDFVHSSSSSVIPTLI